MYSIDLVIILFKHYLDNTNLVPRSKTPTNFEEEKECSFHPNINPISAVLANKTKEEKKPPVWESLYKLNNERKAVLEQKKERTGIKE